MYTNTKILNTVALQTDNAPTLSLSNPVTNDLLSGDVRLRGGASGASGPGDMIVIGVGGAGGGATGGGVQVGVGVGGGATGTGANATSAPLVGAGVSVGDLAITIGVGTGGFGAPVGAAGPGVSVGVGAGGGTGSAGGITIGVGTGSGGGAGPGGGITIGVGTGAGGGFGAGGTGGSGSGGAGAGGMGTGTNSGAGSVDPHTAFKNIFQLESVAEIPASVDAQLDVLEAKINNGEITDKQAVLAIVDAAAPFTAVAVASYQFFTGLTPSRGGLDYLVESDVNTGDLSDAYYSNFNLENRYINFASNLGLHSDAAPEFAQVYGAMSFKDAVATAYERIVGAANAQAAGVNPDAAIADIASRQGAFEAVAHERFGGDDFNLSTKLAAIAYIMQEAVRADVGNYGEANQNFLFDLADGDAKFNVDLVGTYGHATPMDVA